MIVRTYGRRKGGGIPSTYSDTELNDAVHDDDDVGNDPFGFSLSQPQESSDPFNFSSQEDSSSGWAHFDSDPYVTKVDSLKRFPLGGVVAGGSKKAKTRKEVVGKNSYRPPPPPSILATSTLMEAQEFGEMMEHVDEVNFALDVLRKGQPVRIRKGQLALIDVYLWDDAAEAASQDSGDGKNNNRGYNGSQL